MSIASLPMAAIADDNVLARTLSSIDVPRLVARGWDTDRLVFAPVPSDDLFGYDICERMGCGRGGRRGRFFGAGLCDNCLHNWRTNHAETVSIEEFKLRPHRPTRRARASEKLCRVCCLPGHERRARAHGLCRQCDVIRRRREQTVALYVRGDEQHAAAPPLPTLPECEVDGCRDNIEHVSTRLCHACAVRHQRRHRHLTLEQFKERGMFEVVTDGRSVPLDRLGTLARAQFLFGVQQLMKLEIQAPTAELDAMARRIVMLGIDDLRTMEPPLIGGRKCRARYARIFRSAAQDAASTLEEELTQDIWRKSILYPNELTSRGATIDFLGVEQPWLRAVAKAYCANKLTQVGWSALGSEARYLERWSKSLTAAQVKRPDDIERDLLDRYVVWTHTSQVPGTARAQLRSVRDLLRFVRRRGLTRKGQPCWGLRDEVDLLDEDLKSRRDALSDDYEPGKALPEYVLAQLLTAEALSRLEGVKATALELLAHTGRRPKEVLALPADCLVYLEQTTRGDRKRRPALRYRRFKKPAKTVVLPIHETTAALIKEQQKVVQRMHPGQTLASLKLFPRPTLNPRGDKAITSSTFSTQLREWVNDLPSLVDSEGESFDREQVFPYALRHSYAQRHADNGTPLDVLQVLMDHRSPTTTQIYYRVRDERLHAAVAAVGPLTTNAAGERVGAGMFPDADQLSRSIGQIPVPLGYCTEPHNVKALGSSCPFSHQCLGCDHYRTDPSYLPDLYAYLERLLDARERLRSTVPELAEWARAKALPNDAEITAVRNLIRSNEELRDSLEDDERRKLEELLRLLRAQRAKVDNALPIEQVGSVRQSDPTFTPPSFTPLAPPALS